MSLKVFHVVFIVLAILFSGWFGQWSWETHRAGATGTSLAMAVIGFGAAVGLVIYLVAFLRKLRDPAFWNASVTPVGRTRDPGGPVR